jgi:hypothetical protein
MRLNRAASNTELMWGKNSPDPLPDPRQSDAGDDLAHVRYVIRCVADGIIEGEKGHRWLGWAQGFLVASGMLTLVDCKYCNVLS